MGEHAIQIRPTAGRFQATTKLFSPSGSEELVSVHGATEDIARKGLTTLVSNRLSSGWSIGR